MSLMIRINDQKMAEFGEKSEGFDFICERLGLTQQKKSRELVSEELFSLFNELLSELNLKLPELASKQWAARMLRPYHTAILGYPIIFSIESREARNYFFLIKIVEILAEALESDQRVYIGQST